MDSGFKNIYIGPSALDKYSATIQHIWNRISVNYPELNPLPHDFRDSELTCGFGYIFPECNARRHCFPFGGLFTIPALVVVAPS